MKSSWWVESLLFFVMALPFTSRSEVRASFGDAGQNSAPARVAGFFQRTEDRPPPAREPLAYHPSMARLIDPASARAYVDRDWRRLRANKRAYWRERLECGGLAEALSITEQMRTWLREQDAAWPTEQEREEDLETHRRVAAALACTAPTSPHRKAATTRRRARRVR